MKLLIFLLISVFCFSFCPITEKVIGHSKPGFYVYIEDFTSRSQYKFIVESKDSVDVIFNQFFKSELELGEVDNPISIYNRKHSFYVARVTVYKTSNGTRRFRNLNYPEVYIKRNKTLPTVRTPRRIVIF